MHFGISFGRDGDVQHRRHEEYLENTKGMVRVPGAYAALLINESRYILLRIVKTITALVTFAMALVLLAYATLGGLMSLLSGFQGKGPLGPIAIIWVPMAFVGAYALASVAILSTEKYTRDTAMPGVTEIECPSCHEKTPLFRKCAECGIEFAFDMDIEDGIGVGLIHIANWLLSALWYVICAAGLLIILMGLV